MTSLTKKIRLLILPLALTACVGVQPYMPSVPYGVNVNHAPRSYSNTYYQQPQQQPYYVKPKHSKHHDYNEHEHHDNGKHKGQHKNKHHDD